MTCELDADRMTVGTLLPTRNSLSESHSVDEAYEVRFEVKSLEPQWLVTMNSDQRNRDAYPSTRRSHDTYAAELLVEMINHCRGRAR